MKRKKGRISSSEKEFVVKTSFGSILREPKLAEPVRILADTVSRISNRGAIIFNVYLIHCIENDIPLLDLKMDSTYYRAFNAGIEKRIETNEIFASVIKKYFSNFPTPERIKGQGQAVLCASNQYETNFLNSLWMNYDARNRRIVTRELVDVEITDK